MTPELLAKKAVLDAHGIIFADCTQIFGVGDGYVKAAQEQYQRDGEIEVDDIAVVSDSENGAYVMAWVWVGEDEK